MPSKDKVIEINYPNDSSENSLILILYTIMHLSNMCDRTVYTGKYFCYPMKMLKLMHNVLNC